ncbi:MAG: nucleoside phosphorylase [Bacteroidota bacterium]|nr:nucleoside phosphorylase [Bacteroidota bacterium]
MRNYISETDLIINPNGSIYHLGIKPNDLAKTVILVGDPERVPKVSAFFDQIHFKHRNRELHTHTGTFGNEAISVLSTGMGTDNIDIVMNEVDALFNIDFETRQPKEKITKLRFIRLGTSGSLHADISIDSILVSGAAVGFDSLANYYKTIGLSSEHKKFHEDLKEKLVEIFENTPTYFVPCSDELYNRFSPHFANGITATCPGFYGPQGRSVRIELSDLGNGLLEFLQNYKYGSKRITNFEMETAGIYLMANLLGHQAISLNAILANRVTKQFSTQADVTINKMVGQALALLFPN